MKYLCITLIVIAAFYVVFVWYKYLTTEMPDAKDVEPDPRQGRF